MSDSLSEQGQNILTQREREVIILVTQGLTNEQIAERMGTRISTVKAYLHQAFVKLNVRNRTQAVLEALKQANIAEEGLYSLEEMADWLSSIGPEVLEAAAKILRQRQAQEQGKTYID